MEFREIKSVLQRTWQFENTNMLPNVLLMCKLLVLILWANNYLSYIGDPHIPIISAFDYFRNIPGLFKTILITSFILASVALFLNYKVRNMAIVLGMVIILNTIASIPTFRNHTFVCGGALLLAGLSNKNQDPRLLYLQLSIIYFGASINKISDPDWWSGVFMDAWLTHQKGNQFYIYFSEFLPQLWLAKFMSWSAFTTEFLMGVLLLFKKQRVLVIWFVIVFHMMLFTIVRQRFGHFLDALFIVLIAFMIWPKKDITIHYKKNTLRLFKKLILLTDLDRKYIWSTEIQNNDNWIEFKSKNKESINSNAIKDIILYSPAFYFIIFGIDIINRILFNNPILFYLSVSMSWCLIILFAPIPWSRLSKKNTLGTNIKSINNN